MSSPSDLLETRQCADNDWSTAPPNQPTVSKTPSLLHRPRTLHHLDRRLATHHPRPDAPDLQQRRPTPRRPNRQPNQLLDIADSRETLRQTRHHGYHLPPRYDGIWRLYALGQGQPSHQGHGHWRLWKCGVDSAGVGCAAMGDGR